MKLERNALYPVPSKGFTVHAQWTGEFRPPRKGEWYLSGAIVEAYQAPNDLSTSFHIATLYETRTVTEIVSIAEKTMDYEEGIGK